MTFRVRGIPRSCKLSETEVIIKTALRLENERPNLQICSIAFNPYRLEQEKVATIRFDRVPSSLSINAGKDEWRFPLPRSELRRVFGESDDDASLKDAEIVFDSHFRGFTSLRSFQNALDHKIEYVTIL